MDHEVVFLAFLAFLANVGSRELLGFLTLGSPSALCPGTAGCMIKISRAGVVTHSKPPPPYEQLLPLPTPCFKMFLERSLNDPLTPHHPTSYIHHCYPPSPSTTPLHTSITVPPLPIHHPFPPLKILIIHWGAQSTPRPPAAGNNDRWSLHIPHVIYKQQTQGKTYRFGWENSGKNEWKSSKTQGKLRENDVENSVRTLSENFLRLDSEICSV